MNYPDLKQLIICRDLLLNPVIKTLQDVLAHPGCKETGSALASILLDKAEAHGLSGNILPMYFLYLLGEGQNIAARSIEAHGVSAAGMEAALTRDMQILLPYLNIKTSTLAAGLTCLDDYAPARPIRPAYLTSLEQYLFREALSVENNPVAQAAFCARALIQHYRAYGSGKLARFIAFRVSDDGKLIGIDDFPVFEWDDLIGYEDQKAALQQNTVNFIENRLANNVLLTGARGTGKSTGVKALVARYHERGLRLIQITQSQLAQLPTVMENLRRIKSKKFILFFDDLSFDEGESDYKYLKSVIDGGVTPQPENVLIYATSNRRHLLNENAEDRKIDTPDMYSVDRQNESISLSDRFGLILHYYNPTQDEYLAIIRNELSKSGIVLEGEDLRLQAVRWELEHSGRNGRIAKQFVSWYLGNLQK